MSDWRLVDSEWVNFDKITLIFVYQISEQKFEIHRFLDGCRAPLFDGYFSSKEEAQKFLNEFMEKSVSNDRQKNETNQWIDIKDRLPPNDVYVLVSTYDGRPNVNMHFVSIAARMNHQWVDSENGKVLNPKYGVVTHWMPKPDPAGD